MIAAVGALVTAVCLASAVPALASGCPREQFRTGRSVSLPDCRAYELVTPEELGRSQAIAFERGTDRLSISADGEHLALSSFAPLEPSPSELGTRAVFSRSPEGWRMTSAVPPDGGALEYELKFTSSDMSLLGFETGEPYSKSRALEVGPVGGPYTRITDEPKEDREELRLAGANSGTASVPPFHNVLFESANHGLLPPGHERELAEEVPAGIPELYEWSEGRLRLVNVEGEGAATRLAPGVACGGASLGTLGADGGPRGGAIGAVSPDGSQVLFMTPQPTLCSEQPKRLWLRVDGRETVEVSAPAPGVVLAPSERSRAEFNEAVPDGAGGSEVFFETATPLTAGENAVEREQGKLFMFDTRTRSLTLIEPGILEEHGGTVTATKPLGVLVSEDGSTIYYDGQGSEGEGMYRYVIDTGERSFVARSLATDHFNQESSYTTPDGRYLAFFSSDVEVIGPHGVELEPRGAGRAELYRYDAVDGSVMCVSCGSGSRSAPEGGVLESETTLEESQQTPSVVEMSEDGARMFFQTTARLVPEDTNSTEEVGATVGGSPGMDTYEWEAEGTEEGPGVFCRVVVGCTHLISAGEDVGAEHFLGASKSGQDVFFSSAAQLLPQATPEFPNIYDARIDGGFPRKQAPVECAACQGVGAPVPLFGAPASSTFVGAGNLPLPVGGAAPAPVVKPIPKSRAKSKSKCRRGYRRRRGRCVRVARKGRVVR